MMAEPQDKKVVPAVVLPVTRLHRWPKPLTKVVEAEAAAKKIADAKRDADAKAETKRQADPKKADTLRKF